MTDIVERLRDQAWRRSGAPKMDAGHTKLLEWEAAAEIERLRGQLPEGMQHCTILFMECEKGHGRLTATNWIDHGCPHCEIERLRVERDAQYDENVNRIAAEGAAILRAEAAEAENADLKKVMETMRPVWADATIVGCIDTALAGLWTELEAKHQTEAMQKLRDLKALLGQSND